MASNIKLGMLVQLKRTTQPEKPLGRVVAIVKKRGGEYQPGDVIVKITPEGVTDKFHQTWLCEFRAPRYDLPYINSWSYGHDASTR